MSNPLYIACLNVAVIAVVPLIIEHDLKSKLCRISICFLWLGLCFSSHMLQEMQDTVVSPEKAEEVKLKARYPHLGTRPGGSDLFRKRLHKGVRF